MSDRYDCCNYNYLSILYEIIGSNFEELDTVRVCVVRVEDLGLADLLESGAGLEDDLDWHLVKDLILTRGVIGQV